LVSLDGARMPTLKVVCLFFCAMGIASAISGVAAISFTPGHTEIARHNWSGRLFAVGVAVFFLLAWYGIHKRHLATWWLGWLVFFGVLGDFLYSSLTFAFGLSATERWVLLGGIILIVTLVFGYWASWWKRQRAYFHGTLTI
jgi:hypothetical protein